MGSPINNRALFPCQEPPVAMSTWQATVRAAASFVVLMSGENSAKPTPLQEGTVCVFFLIGVWCTHCTQRPSSCAIASEEQLCWWGWNKNPARRRTGLGRGTWESGYGVPDSPRQSYQFIDDSRVTLTWWFVEQKWVVLVEDFLDRQVCHGNTLELSYVWFGYGIHMWLSVFLRGSTQAGQLAGLGNLSPRCARKMVVRANTSPRSFVRYLLVQSPLSI